MAIKILATADIHIGKKSSGVRGHVAESATKFTWYSIVNWVIVNKVDVLVLAGDVIDRDNRYFEATGPLQAGFEKLNRANIEVFMIAGNHDFDVLPQIVDAKRFPNVHLLGSDGTWELQTFIKNEMRVQFAGWSFPTQFVYQDPVLKWNLEIDPNFFTVGLLHGDFDTPLSRYAPVHSAGLLNRSVDVWILGHIHKPQRVRDFAPIVFYPGSPHALSFKEPGAHGAVLLTVESSHDVKMENILLSPIRFEKVEVDITEARDEATFRFILTSAVESDAREKLQDLENVAYLIYDVSLTGQHNNAGQLETWTSFVGDYEYPLENKILVTIQKVTLLVKPVIENMEELAQQASPAGVLARSILALQSGEKTEFVDGILEKWKRRFRAINRAGVYQPLFKQNIEDEADDLSKEYVLNECNRLLSELMSQ